MFSSDGACGAAYLLFSSCSDAVNSFGILASTDFWLSVGVLVTFMMDLIIIQSPGCLKSAGSLADYNNSNMAE